MFIVSCGQTASGPSVSQDPNPGTENSGTISSTQNQNQYDYESSLEFKLYEFDSAAGSLVYLHGDGADEFNDTFFTQLTAIAYKHQMHLLMVKAPDSTYQIDDETQQEVMSVTWRVAPLEGSDKLDSLLQYQFLDDYPVYMDSVFFVGVSGGSHFLTEYFIPLYGENYGGGSYLFCGGSSNKGNTNLSFNSFEYPFFMSYYTATGDEKVFEDVQTSALEYEQYGFEVITNFPEESGHCNFNQIEILDSLLSSSN
jgi:hypothetical protein